MSYVPMAGSLPEKAIAYLREREGEEIEDSALADAMGTRRSWLFQTLKTAIKHGVVTRSVRVIKGGTRTLWSITGEGAKRLPEDERTVVRASPPALGWVPPNVPLFPGPYAEPGELEPLRDADQPPAEVVPEVMAAPSAPARFAIWSDGQLEIRRDSDGPVLLAPAEIKALARFIERVSVEEGAT